MSDFYDKIDVLVEATAALARVIDEESGGAIKWQAIVPGSPIGEALIAFGYAYARAYGEAAREHLAREARRN